MMKYFSRLNTNNINPLVAEALKVNKKLHEEDIYSWYTFANNIFKEFELSLSRHFEYANKQITYHFWLCMEYFTFSNDLSIFE
jgi:hypothetical protein